MEIKRFKAGEVIFEEWTLGGEMYEIKSGSVGIYANYGKAGEQKLTELGAGRIFGELAAIDIDPRSATAVALADTEAEVIVPDDLKAYFAEKPEKILEIMRSIGRRTRELTGEYMEVCGAIRELDACRKTGAERSTGLVAKLKRFIDRYAEVQQLILKYDPGALASGYGMNYYY